ncbi:PiggyBac transposable element-derived protein 4 [Anthophora retusa]
MSGFTEYIADRLSDYSVQSENSDIEVEDSDSDVAPRRKSKAVPLQYSGESDGLSDSEMLAESLSYTDTESWSDVDKAPDIPEFIAEPGPKIFPANKQSIKEIVEMVIGNDLFALMMNESNTYYHQNKEKMCKGKKMSKWNDISLAEMKKFLGMIVLMGQVKKDRKDDYWSSEFYTKTPSFATIMSRNRFRQIWDTWHFSNNRTTAGSNKLEKIRPILNYLLDKFKSVYTPRKELSLDESIIPWRGKLSIKTYNPAKLIKYGLLCRMLCEAKSGYICNIEIYCADGKKLDQTIMSLLDTNIGLGYHLYMDNYYNSVRTAELLLKNGTRVCGTIRANRGIPESMKHITLKTGDYTFKRKNEILVQAWKPKRKIVYMISTIHSAELTNTTKVHWKTKQAIIKPQSVIEYNKYMMGVDLADQFLSYYSILRKTVKWTKKTVLFLLNCALFNAYRLYVEFNGNTIRYKQFLHAVGRLWIEEYSSAQNVSSDCAEEIPTSALVPTPRTPKYDHPQRLSACGFVCVYRKFESANYLIIRIFLKFCNLNKLYKELK